MVALLYLPGAGPAIRAGGTARSQAETIRNKKTGTRPEAKAGSP
jgi:hypothetical protein